LARGEKELESNL
jgi:23S rRNA G2445 N2-methylase RlmL